MPTECLWRQGARCSSKAAPKAGEAITDEDCASCPVRDHAGDEPTVWGLYVKHRRPALLARAGHTANSPVKNISPPPPIKQRLPCLNLGEVEDKLGCNCMKKWVRKCAVHGKCTLSEKVGNLACCTTCEDYITDE